jgi:hypothetical protein
VCTITSGRLLLKQYSQFYFSRFRRPYINMATTFSAKSSIVFAVSKVAKPSM